MKHLLATVVGCALLAGCTQNEPDPFLHYTDQRSVTTRPAAADGRKADVVVRICEVQNPPGAIVSDGAPAADAKLLASMEVLATLGTPFYCTTRLPEQRLEVGGVVTRLPNGTYRVQSDFADRTKRGQRGLSTLNEIPMGQTKVLVGNSDGTLVTLVLEPVAVK